MSTTARWQAVKSDGRFYVRQVLRKEADGAERDLVHAKKCLEAGEVARLEVIVEACRAALGVLDNATTGGE